MISFSGMMPTNKLYAVLKIGLILMKDGAAAGGCWGLDFIRALPCGLNSYQLRVDAKHL